MYFLKINEMDKQSEIICLNPYTEESYIEDKLKNGEYIKLSEYFYHIYYPKYINQVFYFNIKKETTFKNLCIKIQEHLNLYSIKNIKFWYNANNWYITVDANDHIINIAFISPFADDRFIIEIIDLGNNKFAINVKMILGFFNNFVSFVNNLEKELNPERFDEEGYILEKKKNAEEDRLWRSFFRINNEDKFGIAISYLVMMDMSDRLFGIFVLNILIQCNTDFVVNKLLEKEQYLHIILNSITFPINLALSKQLIERTLFVLNTLSKNKKIHSEILKNKVLIDFFKNAKSLSNNKSELSVIKTETTKLLN